MYKWIKEHLDKGENVKYNLIGQYETKIMGNDSIRKGIFLATNKRLLFFAKKLIGFDLEIFPYKKISIVIPSVIFGIYLIVFGVMFFVS